MTTRAVVIDVLGTLVELLPPAPRLRAALARRGIEVSADAAAAAIGAEIAYYLVHHMEGADPGGLDRLRDRCAREVAREIGSPPERHADVRAAMLEALEFAPFPDAVPALRALRERGVRVVAASNWDCSLGEALERTGLAALVDGAVSSAVAGAAKPHPAVFHAALDLAGCGPAEALCVGDSVENDVEGARRAGLPAVLLARDGAAPPGVAAIRSLEELPALIGERPSVT